MKDVVQRCRSRSRAISAATLTREDGLVEYRLRNGTIPVAKHIFWRKIMSKRRPLPDPGRRKFLKGATLAGAAAAVTPPVAAAAQGVAPRANLKAAAPGPVQTALETSSPEKDPQTQTTSGGDFMVDVLKTLDIDYLAMNCASSFRGLHEAVINYGKNVKPEILTCNHEEIAVAMGHGYAKMEGKPLAMICHGVVGLRHATMALY